jgi:YegS/Rv2252/BmrU family lipid kinase
MSAGDRDNETPQPAGPTPEHLLPPKAALEERIRRQRTVALLVNTHSRRGRDLFEATIRLLAAEGYRVSAAFPVHDVGSLGAAIEQAVATEPSLLVVGSGDGTVSTVVGHLAYRDVALGLLPFGTTNNFARNLGLPFSLEQAVRVITRGKVVDIDLGLVDDHYFANVASIGVSVEVARRVSARLKRVVGRPAYTVAGAQAFVSHEPFRAVVRTPNARHEFFTHQLVVANGGYHGGRIIAHGASVEDRELTIFPLGDHRRSRFVAGLAAYAYGRRKYVAEGDFISTPEAVIECDPSRHVEIDGEIQAVTPITVSVARQALRIIAPQDFEDL